MTNDTGPLRGIGELAAAAAGRVAEILTEVARASDVEWEEARGAAAQGRALAARAAQLAEHNAAAFRDAVLELRAPGGGSVGSRNERLGDALYGAGETASSIADLSADVAELAQVVAEHGRVDRRADAAAGALLAVGCAGAATHLVEVNLGAGQDDARVLAARAAVARSVAAAERAGGLGP